MNFRNVVKGWLADNNIKPVSLRHNPRTGVYRAFLSSFFPYRNGRGNIIQFVQNYPHGFTVTVISTENDREDVIGSEHVTR